jgi:hypothetical protein
MDHFVLYDNESTDAPERVLAPFTEKGIVTLIKWHGKKADHPTPQSRSISDCKRRANVRKIRWLSTFDIDVFLILRGVAADSCVDPRRKWSSSSALHASLKAKEDERVGTVIADRYKFGTNGLNSREVHQIQTTAFTRRKTNHSHIGKPLVLLKALTTFSGFHAVHLTPNWSVKTTCNNGTSCPFELCGAETTKDTTPATFLKAASTLETSRGASSSRLAELSFPTSKARTRGAETSMDASSPYIITCFDTARIMFQRFVELSSPTYVARTAGTCCLAVYNKFEWMRMRTLVASHVQGVALMKAHLAASATPWRGNQPRVGPAVAPLRAGGRQRSMRGGR